MITKKDWENALNALEASNASGLLRSLGDEGLRDRIRSECKSTQEFNQHPIVVLYVCQLHQLAGLGLSDRTAFCKAYDVVLLKNLEVEEVCH